MHSRVLKLTDLRPLAALSMVLASACARTNDSTETGNPPVIDADLIALVAEDGEVHVVGEPKAVVPGGGELEVETLASGARARGLVDEDGSFDIAVDGTLDDTYRLRALGAEDVASESVYLDRDGITDAPDGGVGGVGGDAGTLTCAERVTVIADRIAEVEADADQSCTSNYGCGEIAPPVSCPSACRSVALAYASEPETSSALEEIGTSLCEPFGADDCFDGLPQPDCAIPQPIVCVDQVCTRCQDGACDATTCEACSTPLITWSTMPSTEGPGPGGGRFTLEDCNMFWFAPVGDGPPCGPRELPCVQSSDFDSAYSVAHVQNALGHPEVQAALAAGTNFGAITPGGFGFSFGVGDQSIFISEATCEGAASCTDAPIAIDAVRNQLENLAIQASPCDPGG